jgi:hypothetical protein
VDSSHKQQDAHLWLIAKNENSSKLLVEKHVVTVKWEVNGDQMVSKCARIPLCKNRLPGKVSMFPFSSADQLHKKLGLGEAHDLIFVWASDVRKLEGFLWNQFG